VSFGGETKIYPDPRKNALRAFEREISRGGESAVIKNQFFHMFLSPLPQRQKRKNMASNFLEYCEIIALHYSGCWNAQPQAVDFQKGPIHELPADFQILKFPPAGKHRMWAYCTRCMSQPNDARPIELHMFTRERHDNLAELLVATAHYHRTGSPLDVGHSINFGRPWLKGSSCDRGLISLPYLDGPALEWLQVNEQKVRFLWLIPVTKSEIEFKKTAGLEALEEWFQQAKLDYLNPFRASVV
jgi:hypothetical protein